MALPSPLADPVMIAVLLCSVIFVVFSLVNGVARGAWLTAVVVVVWCEKVSGDTGPASGHSAVDADVLGTDPLGFVAGQEEYKPGNVIGFTDTVESGK